MTLLYPSLPGLTFSTSKEPKFHTRTQNGVSGRELRLSFQPVPTWTFKLKYEFLRDAFDVRGGHGLGAGFNELRTLMGFFLAAQGSLTPFWFNDPTDNVVTGQALAFGDGTTTQFQLVRTMVGGFAEPILAVNAVTAVYLSGVGQSFANFSVNVNTGVITFTTPPGNGVTITADFSYYFLCRFADDTLSFENFMYQLWSMGELKLQSVLL